MIARFQSRYFRNRQNRLFFHLIGKVTCPDRYPNRQILTLSERRKTNVLGRHEQALALEARYVFTNLFRKQFGGSIMSNQEIDQQGQPVGQFGPLITLNVGLTLYASTANPCEHGELNSLYLRAAKNGNLEKRFSSKQKCDRYIKVGLKRLRMDKGRKKMPLPSERIAEAPCEWHHFSIDILDQIYKSLEAIEDHNAIIAFNYLTANTPAEVEARQCGTIVSFYDMLKEQKISLVDLYAQHLGISRSTFYDRLKKGRESLRERLLHQGISVRI